MKPGISSAVVLGLFLVPTLSACGSGEVGLDADSP